MSETRTYHAPALDARGLAGALQDRLMDRGFSTQAIPTLDGVIVQARKTSWFEHGTALTIRVRRQGEAAIVDVGTGKWGLNAAEGAAALLLFWPLAAIPAWSAYQIKTTMDEIWGLVEGYVAVGRQRQGAPRVAAPVTPPKPAPAPKPKPRPAVVSPWACPNCGAETKRGARFCGKCGARLS